MKIAKNLILSIFIALIAPATWAASGYRGAPPAAKPGKPAPRKPVPVRKVLRKSPVRASEVVEPTFDPQNLVLRSNSVLVYDQASGVPVLAKNVDTVQPIASITKLMTALVVVESKLDLDEVITIDEDDVDTLKHTRSRLPVGTMIRRSDLLRLALMASENRAAAALARTYPGGTTGFVTRMNERAAELGLHNTRFHDSSGLSPLNVSCPEDLARLVLAAYKQPLIRDYSTTPEMTLALARRNLAFNNTNALVKNDDWNIGLQKTGFIREAGQCLVMQAQIGARQFVIVLLDAVGKYSRIGDANRIKKWLEFHSLQAPAPNA